MSPHLAVHKTQDVHDLFARQHTSSADLPDPRPLVSTLAGGVLEVLAGVREVNQLARWLDEEPYETLVLRANLAVRARRARGRPAQQPADMMRRVRGSSPAAGVGVATAIITPPVRTRAVAMRLEGYDGRWRATSLAML